MARGKSVTYENKVFGSVYEVARYITLKQMQTDGEIYQLNCHPRFLLCPEIFGFTVITQIYSRKKSLPELWAEFDFSYIKNGKNVIEDVKADGDFTGKDGKWNTAKKGWLLEESFLIKMKMFLWMKDPTEWDFIIPVITKEELKHARKVSVKEEANAGNGKTSRTVKSPSRGYKGFYKR